MLYCSIGEFCYSSSLLQRLKLKQESYPFDWLISSASIVVDCLKDDFAKFLDKSYYERFPNKSNSNRISNHTLYSKMIHYAPDMIGVSSFFMHRDLVDIPSDYEYYQRCVNRFRSLLKSSDKKTFIFNSRNEESSLEQFSSDVLMIKNELDLHTSNFKIVAIKSTVRHRITHNIRTFGDDVTIIDLSIINRNQGLYFDTDEENKYIEGLIHPILIS